MLNLNVRPIAALAAFAACAALPAVPALAKQEISNNMAKCAPGAKGPAVKVTVHGFKQNTGNIRVQSYPAVKGKWLEKGQWINRIDVPVSASADKMTFCMPLPSPGSYGIAVRHDVDGSGKSGWNDGGGFSGNPDISLMNLKPSAGKTAITVNQGVANIDIILNYRQGLSIKPI